MPPPPQGVGFVAEGVPSPFSIVTQAPRKLLMSWTAKIAAMLAHQGCPPMHCSPTICLKPLPLLIQHV